MQDFNFVSPRTLEEALHALAESGGRVIAGGTDVIPQMLNGRFQTDCLVNLGSLNSLSFIEQRNGEVHLGALTTYAQMVDSPLLQTAAPLLVQAAATVGSIQTRQRGTLGGNIGNASPAGDTLSPLLALKARVTLVSWRGERSLPLAELLLGPGKTAIAADEVIHSIQFERPHSNARSVFLKLGNRQGMAVSVVSAALILRPGTDGCIEDVRIALGAVAPTAMRCPEAERLIIGQKPTDAQIEAAAEAAASACAPITDVRGTAAYRRHAVRVLVKRGLCLLAHGMQSEELS